MKLQEFFKTNYFNLVSRGPRIELISDESKFAQVSRHNHCLERIVKYHESSLTTQRVLIYLFQN